jgi:hypothetical protein
MTAVASFKPPTPDQIIAELERELALRRSVYALAIYRKKLKQHEADYRNACLLAAIDIIRTVRDHRGGEG